MMALEILRDYWPIAVLAGAVLVIIWTKVGDFLEQQRAPGPDPGAYGDGAWRSEGDAWPRDRRGE